MKLRQAKKIYKKRWTSPLNEPRDTTRDRARKVMHRISFNPAYRRQSRLYVDLLSEGRRFSSIAYSLGRVSLSPREVSATPPDNTTN